MDHDGTVTPVARLDTEPTVGDAKFTGRVTSHGCLGVRYWWDAVSRAAGVTGGGCRRSAPVVAIVAFLTTTDGTIVNVALPSIQRDLRMSLPVAEWVVTGYLITFSALLPSGGRMTDRYGRRLVLELGLCTFTAASLLAGLVSSPSLLLLARMAQGAGAAFALPAGLTVAASGRTARERDTIAAVWMASIASALAMGPFLGGWISQHLRWNWIFLMNLPAGLAGVLITRHAVEDSRRDETAHAGWAAPVLCAAALAAATFVLTDGGLAGWTSPRIILAAAVSLGAAVGFWSCERRSPAPMIDRAVLRGRVLGGGVAASVMWGAGINGVLFFTSLFLQRYAGFSATRAGLVFVPVALLVILLTPVTPVLTGRLGAGLTVAGGLLTVAVGLTLLAIAVAPGHGSLTTMFGPAAVIGAGSALTVPLTSSVLASVPPDRVGIASGVLSVAREASGLAGICVIGLVVTSARSAPGSPGAFAHGYERGVVIAAVITVAGAIVAWRTLPGRAGAPPPVRCKRSF